jgi:hypothetical protein
MSWQVDALAMHWPESAVDAFADAVARQQSEVLLVHRDVLALRTGRGALQRTLRADDLACLASANRATEHLAEWVKPADPFCPERECKLRVPCPRHTREDARGGQ